MIFKMAGNFLCSLCLQEMMIFRISGNFFCLPLTRAQDKTKQYYCIFFSFLQDVIQFCDSRIRDSCEIGFRLQFNAEFPRKVMNFPIKLWIFYLQLVPGGFGLTFFFPKKLKLALPKFLLLPKQSKLPKVLGGSATPSPPPPPPARTPMHANTSSYNLFNISLFSPYLHLFIAFFVSFYDCY